MSARKGRHASRPVPGTPGMPGALPALNFMSFNKNSRHGVPNIGVGSDDPMEVDDDDSDIFYDNFAQGDKPSHKRIYRRKKQNVVMSDDEEEPEEESKKEPGEGPEDGPEDEPEEEPDVVVASSGGGGASTSQPSESTESAARQNLKRKLDMLKDLVDQTVDVNEQEWGMAKLKKLQDKWRKAQLKLDTYDGEEGDAIYDRRMFELTQAQIEYFKELQDYKAKLEERLAKSDGANAKSTKTNDEKRIMDEQLNQAWEPYEGLTTRGIGTLRKKMKAWAKAYAKWSLAPESNRNAEKANLDFLKAQLDQQVEKFNKSLSKPEAAKEDEESKRVRKMELNARLEKEILALTEAYANKTGAKVYRAAITARVKAEMQLKWFYERFGYYFEERNKYSYDKDDPPTKPHTQFQWPADEEANKTEMMEDLADFKEELAQARQVEDAAQRAMDKKERDEAEKEYDKSLQNLQVSEAKLEALTQQVEDARAKTEAAKQAFEELEMTEDQRYDMRQQAQHEKCEEPLKDLYSIRYFVKYVEEDFRAALKRYSETKEEYETRNDDGSITNEDLTCHEVLYGKEKMPAWIKELKMLIKGITKKIHELEAAADKGWNDDEKYAKWEKEYRERDEEETEEEIKELKKIHEDIIDDKETMSAVIAVSVSNQKHFNPEEKEKIILANTRELMGEDDPYRDIDDKLRGTIREFEALIEECYKNTLKGILTKHGIENDDVLWDTIVLYMQSVGTKHRKSGEWVTDVMDPKKTHHFTYIIEVQMAGDSEMYKDAALKIVTTFEKDWYSIVAADWMAKTKGGLYVTNVSAEFPISEAEAMKAADKRQQQANRLPSVTN